MSRHIFNLIGQGEHQHLDFKYQINDAKKIARSVSAFANTEGGRLLIGVKDNGRIAGIRSEEEFFMIESASEIFCRPSVKIDAIPWNIQGKYVLEVKIPIVRENSPILAPDADGKWKAYVRHKDMNLVADDILHSVWECQRKEQGAYIHYSEAEKRVVDAVSENPLIGFNDLLRITSLKINVLRRILINFVLIDVFLLKPDISGSKFMINKNFYIDDFDKVFNNNCGEI